MKTILQSIALAAMFLSSLQAFDSFPKEGSTYLFTYSNETSEVLTIITLKDNWCLVQGVGPEYDRAKSITPTASILAPFWLNLDFIKTIREPLTPKETEQGAAANP